MHFSRATDYGILGLIYLAKKHGQPASVTEIAEAEHLSLNFLRKIFQRLAVNGLVTTSRGAGHLLARDPKKITAREVLEAVEGKLAMQDCLSGKLCSVKKCALSPVWAKVQTVLARELDTITIASLTKL